MTNGLEKAKKLTELIERVRTAPGPDRELSRDIWQTLDTSEWKSAYLRAQEPCGCPHDQAVEYAARYLPDITSSIDAALELSGRVLPGWTWMLESTAEKSMVLWKPKAIRATVNEFSATLPLAIIAATLVALQSLDTGGGEE